MPRKPKPRFKLVKFVKELGEYKPGRLALLREELAEHLVAKGVAVPVNMTPGGEVLA